MLPMYNVIIDESLSNKYRALIKKLKLISWMIYIPFIKN